VGGMQTVEMGVNWRMDRGDGKGKGEVDGEGGTLKKRGKVIANWIYGNGENQARRGGGAPGAG